MGVEPPETVSESEDPDDKGEDEELPDPLETAESVGVEGESSGTRPMGLSSLDQCGSA